MVKNVQLMGGPFPSYEIRSDQYLIFYRCVPIRETPENNSIYNSSLTKIIVATREDGRCGKVLIFYQNKLSNTENNRNLKIQFVTPTAGMEAVVRVSVFVDQRLIIVLSKEDARVDVLVPTKLITLLLSKTKPLIFRQINHFFTAKTKKNMSITNQMIWKNLLSNMELKLKMVCADLIMISRSVEIGSVATVVHYMDFVEIRPVTAELVVNLEIVMLFLSKCLILSLHL